MVTVTAVMAYYSIWVSILLPAIELISLRIFAHKTPIEY